MTNDDERGEGGKKCPKFDDVICERPLRDHLIVGVIITGVAVCGRGAHSCLLKKT